MKFVKRLAVVSMSVVTTTALSAKAQYMPGMAGTGFNMGQQGCSTQVQAGNGAQSYLEDYNDKKQAIDEEKKRLSEMERKKKSLDRDLDKARRTIENGVDDKYTETIFAHMDNRRMCDEYEGYPGQVTPPSNDSTSDDQGTVPRGDKEMGEKKSTVRRQSDAREGQQSRLPAATSDVSLTGADRGDGPRDRQKHYGFTNDQWAEVCNDGKRGGIRAIVCTTSPYKSEGRRGGSEANSCKKALEEYRTKTTESQKLADQIEDSKALIARYKEELPELMRDARERYKEDHSTTEGGICMNCIAQGNGYVTQKQGPDWAGVAANVGVGLLAMYAGYKTNKMVAEYNSDLGWPTQPYPAWGYGLPFLANGLYGALGGGVGRGGFACAGNYGGMNGGLYGNMGMQGPYGYPNGMFGGQMGGGMFNGGMGPWGVSGPWGLGNGQMGMPGFPMMGAMSPYGAMGMMSPYGSFVSGGLGAMSPYGMMGMMNPYGGMGMMAGGGLMMSGGLMMNGGMMNPYGGMGMMNPYGMMAGGGLMMSGGLMMNGGMMNPYGMMGGMSPYGTFMSGGLMMGGMMGNMMGGMMGSMMGNGMDMQYQQAMMQMQMQQQQMYMQQQQQQAQNYMARQQTYMGLAQQMSELQAKMQMVMMGGSLGTSIYGGSSVIPATGIYGTGTYGTGNPNVPIPAPGNNGNSLGGGVGGGTIIPAGTR